MKKVIFVTIISLVLVLSAGAFFVVNNFDVLDNYEDSYIEEQNNEELTDKEVNELEDGSDVSSDVSGGSGSGSGSGDTGNPSLTCVNKKIKYSLKNFKENINCLENFEGKCVKLSAICSVDVYNIDVNVDDNFSIEYALIDSSDIDLDSFKISRNVNVNSPVKFNANFTIEDSSGIDVLSKCTPRILEVPEKEICS